jgi:hypothetical protein
VLAWAKDTGADLAKANVNGGAVAIGHPLGRPNYFEGREGSSEDVLFFRAGESAPVS